MQLRQQQQQQAAGARAEGGVAGGSAEHTPAAPVPVGFNLGRLPKGGRPPAPAGEVLHRSPSSSGLLRQQGPLAAASDTAGPAPAAAERGPGQPSSSDCPWATPVLRLPPSTGGHRLPIRTIPSRITTTVAAPPPPGTAEPRSIGGWPRVLAVGCFHEHYATSGEIGRPKEVLCQRFPRLEQQGAFEGLERLWWFSSQAREERDRSWWDCAAGCGCGGGPGRLQLGKTETKEQLRRRVEQFRQWLHTRPEKHIVAVGHSTFIK